MAQNTARGTPARVLVLFALLAGAVTVAAWRDSLRREELEHISYPTAVGDTEYYKPGTESVPLTVQGSIFMLRELPGETRQSRDDKMYRVLLAVPLPRLYTPAEMWPAGEVPPLYLKTAPGEYQRMELRK
jgi:hypothetical protein